MEVSIQKFQMDSKQKELKLDNLNMLLMAEKRKLQEEKENFHSFKTGT